MKKMYIHNLRYQVFFGVPKQYCTFKKKGCWKNEKKSLHLSVYVTERRKENSF
jgi:hypothetical protein